MRLLCNPYTRKIMFSLAQWNRELQFKFLYFQRESNESVKYKLYLV